MSKKTTINLRKETPHEWPSRGRKITEENGEKQATCFLDFSYNISNQTNSYSYKETGRIDQRQLAPTEPS